MNRPKVGDRINNYMLDEQVGVGSFGEVWKAHHHVFANEVAVKIPTDAQFVRQLQREGLAIHGLKHPNIVRAIDMDPYADPPYLIMEFVTGKSLRALISANPDGLPLDSVIGAVQGIVLALEAAHAANVIHRDIKPANILITHADDAGTGITPDRVRVTDFGLGHVADAATESIMHSGSMATETGKRLTGTLAYMAPEQRDGGNVDARSDLYAVGVVLHEILTGVLPQGSDLPSEIRSDTPRWLDEVFSKCYTRLDRRFGSASELRDKIDMHIAKPPTAVLRRKQVNGRWRCAECSGDVRDEDQFCIHCGLQLVNMIHRCPNCQAYVGRNHQFCIMCGNRRPASGARRGVTANRAAR